MGPEPERVPEVRDLFLCVEWSDLCDVRCDWCEQATRPSPHGHARGLMDPEVFRRLAADLAELARPLAGLAPHWLGESMLHPRYGEMLRMAFDANRGNRAFGYFSTNTNGASLRPEIRSAILEAASRTDQAPGTFKRIFVSIDAARPETFEKLKGRDLLGRIEENVETLVREMTRRGLEFPRVIVKLIVMEDTAAEAGEFLEKWRGIFRRAGVEAIQENYDHEPHFDRHAIFLDKLVGGDPARAESLHREVVTRLGLVPPAEASSAGRLIQSDEKVVSGAPRRPCPALWKSPMVDWQGDLVPCCNDSQGRLRLGNLRERTFRDLWYGQEADEMRVRHVLGDFDFGPCSTCPNQRHPCMADGEIEGWLGATGRRDLIEGYRGRMGLGRG